MLYGMKLELFTDHLDLTFNTSNPKVKRWRLLMAEFDYDLKYIPDKNNKISDEMSIIYALCDNESLMTNDMFYEDLLQETPCNPIPSATFLDNFLGENMDTLDIDFPLAYDVISSHQKPDEHLQRNIYQNPAYTIARVTNKRHEIILCNDKIFIPASLAQPILKWYHLNLHHPGADRRFGTLNQLFFGQI